MRNDKHVARLLATSLAVGLAACAVESTIEPSETTSTTEQELVSCSTFSNGGFVQLYSNSTAAWDTVIAQAPAFVVLGDDVGASNTAPSYFHSRNSAIKVLTYIPMNYGNNGTSFNPQCGVTNRPDGSCNNSPISWNCGQVAIQSRITTAMNAGYDGVFFDETPTNKPTYVASCAQSVKNVSSAKIVIMNPGAVPPLSMFSNNVDIVSVEHNYTANLTGTGIPAWRWMSVENGVNDSGTATSRLATFRNSSHGGFWYYGTPSFSNLPSWLGTEMNAAKPGVPNCGGSGGPSLVPIGIHAFNRADNVPINGLFTTVQTTGGTILHSGFTGDPDFMIAPGTYRVTSDSHYGPYTFHHWDDNSTAQPRTVTVPAAPSGLWVGSWYTVQ
jgi:hypothetical protein